MSVKIAIVGSLNMDLIARCVRFPHPGETLMGRDFKTAPGGKGANQAVAAARMGGSVRMVGCVGKDAFGRELVENISRDGIEHSYVLMDEEAPTGVALIVVDDQGQNSIVVISGANMRLLPEDIVRAQDVIREADVLLLQLESPLESVIQAAKIAHDNDVPVVLNPAPAKALPKELFSLVDVLTPNETETSVLTGLPVSSVDELTTAAGSIHKMGVKTVILTLGSRGALLSYHGRTTLVPPFKVSPVDTTAAGDAFMGGFAVAFAEGKSIEESVRWGNAAGAMATTKLGAQPSLPTREDVMNLLKTQKVGSLN